MYLMFRFLILLQLVWAPLSLAQAKVLILNAANSESENVQKINLALSELPKVDLYLIGEDHRDVVGKKLITEAIRGLFRDSGKKCFFVEDSDLYQSAYNLLPNPIAAIQYKEIFDKDAILFERIIGRAPSYWVDFNNLIVLAKAGYQVLAVDLELSESRLVEVAKFLNLQKPTDDENAKFNYLMMGERNIFMAQNIMNRFSSAVCEKGAFVVGKAHVFEHQPHPRFPVAPLTELVNTPHLTVDLSECQTNAKCEIESTADLNIIINK